jgi:4-aminobutyrate aminotransferase-like enzyme
MTVLAPPLTITAEELDELLDLFEEAVAEVVSPLAATVRA